jgi:nitrogen regulatory protein PII
VTVQKVQRIEIVVDALHARRVIEALGALGLDDYTLIRGVSGSGERGAQLGDEITGVSNNNYILTTCPPEKLDEVTAALRPLLRRFGGICLVSEAIWLSH